MQQVVFSRPYVPNCAGEAILEALELQHQQGDGELSRKVEQRIRSTYQDFEVLLTPSCTSALELSLMLLDVGPGDEVILPSYTFTSMAAAITKFWATPVFCDVDLKTGCLDVKKVEDLISKKTKAISWVNYGGLEPDLLMLKQIAEKYDIALIEDAAHNFSVLTQSQSSLTGDFVAFSFHATKNIQCGEGGAIAIRDSAYISRARIMREKGTNRHDFSSGKVSKYNWVDRGSSYVLSEISAALINCQLDHFSYIQQSRTEIINFYQSKLGDIGEFGWQILEGTEGAAHLFAVIAPTTQKRIEVIDKLRTAGVMAVTHYEDLANSPGANKFKSKFKPCTNSLALSKTLLRLPVYTDMSSSDAEFVVRKFLSVLKSKA